ncbi:30S ribosomal protein S21 [Candidatus Dependentiae bacterium]|nr:30S ribosomal protein S21 [Candidatus Dependentiae bacterium]
MIHVRIEKGDDLEKALRKLKRKMGKEGVMTALKNKRYYEKPSVVKRRKKAKAERRRKRTEKRLRERNLM